MFGEKPQESMSFGRLINERAHDRISELVEKDAQYVVQGGDTDRSDRYVCGQRREGRGERQRQRLEERDTEAQRFKHMGDIET